MARANNQREKEKKKKKTSEANTGAEGIAKKPSTNCHAIDPAISHRSRPKIAKCTCPKATVGLKFDEVNGLDVDYLKI